MTHWNSELRLLNPVEVRVYVKREKGMDRIRAVAPEFGYVIDRTNRRGLLHAVQNMQRGYGTSDPPSHVSGYQLYPRGIPMTILYRSYLG